VAVFTAMKQLLPKLNMDIIHNNPFRILGLAPHATEREIAKRVSDLKIFAEMGKTRSYPFDFNALVPLSRTPDAIAEAARGIEQPAAKVIYSFFWFSPGDAVDDKALQTLGNGHVEKAIELWENAVAPQKKGGDLLGQFIKTEISHRNFSWAKNLSVLYFLHAFRQEEINYDCLFKGFALAGRLFQNGALSAYIRPVAGNHFQVENNRLAITYIDEVSGVLKNYFSIGDHQRLKSLFAVAAAFPDEAQEYLLDSYVAAPIERIQTALEIADQQQKEDPAGAAHHGEACCEDVKNDLVYLRDILGSAHLRYQMVADPVAETLLKCSISYFNHFFEDENTDPGDVAMALLLKADDLAIGTRLKLRIEKNRASYQTYIDGKAERELEKLCWFCEKNPRSSKHTYRHMIYKITDRRYNYDIGGTTIYYKEVELEINRCEHCVKTTSAAGNSCLATLAGVIAAGVGLVVLIHNFLQGDLTVWYWVIGVLTVAGIVFGVLKSERRTKGIKAFNEQGITSHPLVAAFLAEGWQFNHPAPPQ